MKVFLLLLFLSFTVIHFSFSQKIEKLPLEISSDTLEGETTDTSIVYIIKKAAVTIKQKVEVQREKKKQYYYLSWGFHGFVYSERRKANNGNNTYLNLINPLTKERPSYSFGFRLTRAQEKIIANLTLSSKRIIQEFEYTDLNGEKYNLMNNFNYGSLGFQIGKWLKKENKLSYQIQGGIAGDYFISVKGITLDKSDFVVPARLNRIMNYKKIIPSLSINLTLLYKIQNSYIELEPYFMVSPLSATKKNEYFSISRTFIGLRIAYTNKLF